MTSLYSYSGAISCLVVGIGYYSGFFGYMRKWLDGKKKRLNIILSLIDGLDRISDNKDKHPTFTVNDTGLSANLIYQRLGSEYILLVPYDRKYIVEMSQYEAELLINDENPLIITQQPGIPYMVSADSMGGTAIRLTNRETGKTHTYSQHEIPMYGIEVMDF